MNNESNRKEIKIIKREKPTVTSGLKKILKKYKSDNKFMKKTNRNYSQSLKIL